MEIEFCTSSGEVKADTFPFPGLSTSQAMIGVDLPVSSSGSCFTRVRLLFRCSFADRVTAPTDRTAGEVLEPAHF
jgi:hypothetical protein